MSSPIWLATVSGWGKVLGSKTIELSSRTHVSWGAPRLVTIGGKSTTVEVSLDVVAAVCVGLPGSWAGAGRNASRAAPAKTARPITTAIWISESRGDFLATTPWGGAESDISVSTRMA